ncbi:SsgA family sporulation/cell division regulator [Actinacidiphila sp. ITFR-21]|uniref:SsgA family sporulation/cell division regulator n=1 Tax=Actinacidiphila sp. ITFR-21 TaxID=3075199 RepID=UPI00288BE5A4|nr:SsgA family sporulation/cell division regulator [Streptomyces sp. ITFR-21]WNI14287.1 SsgA family sporulation/cell division regulator [Streptomyces sp. ITFR-21]
MAVRPDDGEPMAVRTTGCLELPGEEVALVGAELVYRPGDCLAVRMALRGPDGTEVGWTFGWELLGQGLTGPAGQGDVRVRPVRDPVPMVEVVLASAFGARVRFPARDVRYFVDKVRALASLDAHRVSPALDAELAAIREEA